MKRKYYSRLFLAYSMIVFLFTTIAVGLFLYKNTQLVQMDVANRNQSFVSQTRDQMDMMLNTSLIMMNQLRVNSQLNSYAIQEERDYYTITQVHLDLSRDFGAFASFGYTISITKPEDDLVITPVQTTKKLRYYKEIGLSEQQIVHLSNYMADPKDYSTLYLHARSTDESVSDRFTIVSKNINLDLVFLVSFDEQYLFPSINESEEAFGIVGSDEVYALRSELDRVLIRQLLDDPVSGQYSLYQLPSNVVKGLNYFYITPTYGLGALFRNLLVQALLLYVVLNGFGLIMAWQLANRTYNPIRSIVASFKPFKEMEAKDEMAFIQYATNEIQETNRHLRNLIHHQKLPLKEKFLRDLFYGLLSEEQQAAEMGRHEWRVRQGSVIVIIIELMNDIALQDTHDKKDVMDITSNAIVHIQHWLEAHQIPCEIVSLEYKRHAILVNEQDAASLKLLLRDVLIALEKDFDIQMAASVGPVVSTLLEVDHSFTAALQGLEFHYALDHESVVSTDVIDQEKFSGFYFPLETERDLISYVIASDDTRALSVLRQVLTQNLSARRLSREQTSQFIFIMVSTIHRLLQQLHLRAEDILKDGRELHSELLRCTSSEELRERFTELFQQILSQTKQKREEKDHQIVSRMMELISEHFHEDLSLADIADHFNFSLSKVSTLFKEVAGQNFKDYISEYRVKVAKEILSKDPGVKISDVAAMVGCNNVNTFIRMFKRYEGMPPGQYLQMKL